MKYYGWMPRLKIKTLLIGNQSFSKFINNIPLEAAIKENLYFRFKKSTKNTF